MENIILFLVFLIFSMGIFFIVLKITQSRWFRIRSIVHSQKAAYKEEQKQQEMKRIKNLLYVENEDNLLEIITRLRNGEEVSIPVEAFDFIYRNLNNISIVDKNGIVRLIKDEQFHLFKEKATKLLRIEKENESEEEHELINIYKGSDGTIRKKDIVNNTLTIVTKDGKIFENDSDNGRLLISETKPKENKNEKAEGKNDFHEMKKQLNVMEQHSSIIESKVDELNKKIAASKKHNFSETKPESKKEEISNENDISYSIDKITEKLNVSVSEKVLEKSDVKNTQKKEPILNNEETLNNNSFLNELINEEKSLTLEDKEFQIADINKFKFEDVFIFFDEFFSINNSIKFFKYILSVSTTDYLNYIHYDQKTKTIYIEISLLLFKLYCLIEDKTKDIFLFESKVDIENNFQDDEFFRMLLSRLNRQLRLNLTYQPFYINEEKNQYYIEKKIAQYNSDFDKEHFFKGKFIIVNLNKLPKDFLSEKFIERITSNQIRILNEEEQKGVKFRNLTFKKLLNFNVQG